MFWSVLGCTQKLVFPYQRFIGQRFSRCAFFRLEVIISPWSDLVSNKHLHSFQIKDLSTHTHTANLFSFSYGCHPMSFVIVF